MLILYPSIDNVYTIGAKVLTAQQAHPVVTPPVRFQPFSSTPTSSIPTSVFIPFGPQFDTHAGTHVIYTDLVLIMMVTSGVTSSSAAEVSLPV